MHWIGTFAWIIGLACGAIVIPAGPAIQYITALGTIALILFPFMFLPAYALHRRHQGDPSQQAWSAWGATILIGAALVGVAFYSTAL